MHTEDLGGKVLEHWTPDDVAAAMAKGAITLIDVRTPQEYMFEHIHGALLMPMAGFDPKYLPPVGERPLVLHCGSGVRSRKMAEAYMAAGHTKIAHLDGGFGAWKTANKPYIGTNMATGAPREMGG